MQLGGKDQDYINAIEAYAKAAHHLTVPVNAWLILCPVLASPNELSLAAS